MHARVLTLLISLALLLIGCTRLSQSSREQTDIRAQIQVEPDPPRVGNALLTIELWDAQGSAIEGAQVSVRGDMTHAGMVPEFGEAVEVAAGMYQAPLEWTMAGDWQLTLIIDKGDDQPSQLTAPFALILPAAQP